MTWKVTYSIFFLIYNEYGNLFIYFDFLWMQNGVTYENQVFHSGVW